MNVAGNFIYRIGMCGLRLLGRKMLAKESLMCYFHRRNVDGFF